MVRWRDARRSTNVEDRRGVRHRMGAPMKIGGGMGLVVVLLVLVFGGDPSILLDPSPDTGTIETGAPGTPGTPADDEAAFVSAMLASTEDVWSRLFRDVGATYTEPILVLYTDAVQSACGYSSAATGPFYCPADQRVYIDLGFFRELARMGGAGDFARAYVLGHEIGHHVQRLTGIADDVRRRQGAARREADANALQVSMELQADCLAGVWAYHANRTRRILEPGDVEEGLRAAAAIGDDRLQRNAGRRVSPESFTHGTSAQRVAWLSRGLGSGDVDGCDTFDGSGG